MWFSGVANWERSRDSSITVYLKHILIQAFEHFQVSVLKPLINILITSLMKIILTNL